MFANIGIIVVLCTIVYFCGRYSETGDYQILNGEITGKERVHGTYEQPYSCNCREECSGSGKDRSCWEECDTCYETHYTVKWWANTTIGDMKIDSEDSTSRRVYNCADPQRYTSIQNGEPVSDYSHYTNYIKATRDSLFNTKETKQSFAYPQIYDIYRYNHITNVDAEIDVTKLNNAVSDVVKKLGTQKHANVQVFTTKASDVKALRTDVENQWMGGKVNDVTIFIGTDGKTILDADAFTYARSKQNELFAVKMRDALIGMDYNEINIANTIDNVIRKEYHRPDLKDFEYLKDQVEPPDWCIILCVLLSIFGTLGLSYYFYNNDEMEY